MTRQYDGVLNRGQSRHNDQSRNGHVVLDGDRPQKKGIDRSRPTPHKTQTACICGDCVAPVKLPKDFPICLAAFFNMVPSDNDQDELSPEEVQRNAAMAEAERQEQERLAAEQAERDRVAAEEAEAAKKAAEEAKAAKKAAEEALAQAKKELEAQLLEKQKEFLSNEDSQPEDPFADIDTDYILDKREDWPYITRYGDDTMGIALSKISTTETVFVNGENDAVPINEPGNNYASKLMGMIMYNLRKVQEGSVAIAPTPKTKTSCRASKRLKSPPQSQLEEGDDEKKAAGGKPPERKVACQILVQEVEEMSKEFGWIADDTGKRRANIFWKCMNSFKDLSKPYNTGIDTIVFQYAKIRLGQSPYNLDEFKAAVRAVQLDYEEREKGDYGSGSWTLPIVHLMNGSLIHRGLIPITFHNKLDKHKAQDEARKAHDEIVWQGKDRCRRETRPEVLRQWQMICLDWGLTVKLPLPACTGEPEEPPLSPPTGTKRCRAMSMD